MASTLTFTPTRPFASEGYLNALEYPGPYPRAEVSGFFSKILTTHDPEKTLSLRVGRNFSTASILVSPEELKSKFKLSSEDIEKIASEHDLSQRSVILEQIMRKKDRGNLILNYCSSPLYSYQRHYIPQDLLDKMQSVFRSGPAEFQSVVRSFNVLLVEYTTDPSFENFFLFAHELLNNIFLEEDAELLRSHLETIIRTLNSHIRPELNRVELGNLVHKVAAKLQSLRDLPPAPAPSTPPIAADSSLHLFLKRFGSNETLYSYLKLDAWETAGNKFEAAKRIIDCFRNRNSLLDLSNLNLTSLPNNLNFSWVTNVNLSGNSIKDLNPLAQLRYLETLNLSYNTMGGDTGIQDFRALINLERLNSLILLNMVGNRELIRERLNQELLSCESLQWTDSQDNHRNFTRRPGELLSAFLSRRNRALSSEAALQTQQGVSDLKRLQRAVRSEGLKQLDISSLTSQDINITSWLHRIVSNDPYTSIPIWEQHPHLRPVIAKQVLKLLKYSMENEEYFEMVFKPLLHRSEDFCGDSTLYFLNEMIRRKELFQAANAPIDEAIAVFRKYFPVAIIKEIAQRSSTERITEFLKMGTAESMRKAIELENEDLSVVLHFLIEYGAPLAFREGRYIGTEAEKRQDFIRRTKQELSETLESREDFITYLVNDPEWQRLLQKKDPSFEAEIREITRLYRDEPFTALEEEIPNRSDPEYSRRNGALTQTFKAKLFEAFERETRTKTT